MPNRKITLISALFLAGAAPALGWTAQSHGAAHAQFGNWGVDLAARDPSIRPGADFWRYANNRWFQGNPIPADRTGWGVAAVLSEQIEQQLRDIVEHPGGDSSSRQVADFYASWMDEAGIEQRGTAVLRPYLDRIAAVRNRDDLITLFAQPIYATPIRFSLTQDPGDPSRYVIDANQSGLGMPGRDYYLRDGNQYDRYRAAYRAYLITLQRLAGISDPEARADGIIALEHRMAEAHWTPERNRDVQQTTNLMNRDQLMQAAPQFQWPQFLSQAGLADAGIVQAEQPSAFAAMGRLLDDVPLQTWKDWLTAHFISDNAQFLPRAFDEAKFEFFSHVLQGQERQRERWKRGIGLLNVALGEALGRIYVDRHFPAESRRQMGELIANLRGALQQRLRANPWMDEATRAQALTKLASFDPRIGSPTHYIDYSAMRVDPADLLGNAIRAEEFDWNLQLSRRARPVDRSLWDMTPQTIDAYYNPSLNQITFPAAILQPPYFDPNADPAVNYGAIGAVIGHEIGHGFDDQGRHYDAGGHIRDWWSAVAAQRFTQRTQNLGRQYDGYEAIPGLHVSGDLTMGENIGDLGGLEMAYAAYRRYISQHGEPRVLDGLTGDQRFFLAYAQAWRSLIREGTLRARTLTNPHSPPEWRVNGVVRNVDAWYRAFNVGPGDRLYLPPEQRVHIW